MKISKKLLFFTILLIILSTLTNFFNRTFTQIVNTTTNEPVKASVLISDFNIPVASALMENMKRVEKENPGTIEYTFFDGKGDQTIQNTQLDSILEEKNVDLIMLDVVNIQNTEYSIDKIKENNLPVMFFGNANIQSILSYQKACWAGQNPAEGGVLQGNIIVDAWNKSKISLDKNYDNILQYVMLQGSSNNIYAVARTNLSISTVNEADISTEEIATKICNWKEDEAKDAISNLFLKYGNKIEVIIANNDAMAIGAIKALQEYGYNVGNNLQEITVIGFDGTPEAQDLINKGIMTGTVLTNVYTAASNIYKIGLNLINNRNLVEGTNCTSDSSGQIITAPYEGVLINLD